MRNHYFMSCIQNLLCNRKECLILNFKYNISNLFYLFCLFLEYKTNKTEKIKNSLKHYLKVNKNN